MNEMLRITVRSSANGISTDQLGNRAGVRGEGGRYTTPPDPESIELL
jgi:hypothetical protein